MVFILYCTITILGRWLFVCLEMNGDAKLGGGYCKAIPAECSRLIYACSVSHHQVHLIPGGQPL